MTTAQIRAECRKYAAKYVDLQRKDFIRLGIFGRWDDPYLTMSPQYESVIAGAFVEFLDRGYVYKGLKPVNWCIHDRTALAEAEVEYENHTSPSIWVRFALTSDPAAIDPALAGRKVYGLIWTTTPWTIPANVAIAFHPKFKYVAVEVGDVSLHRRAGSAESHRGEVAAGTAPQDDRGLPRRETRRRRSSAIHFSIAIRSAFSADHVTLEQGTGAVHTAPGHGQEDFEVGVQYGIPVYCPVDPARALLSRRGRSRPLPEEHHRQDGLAGEPDRHRPSEIAWRAAG